MKVFLLVCFFVPTLSFAAKPQKKVSKPTSKDETKVYIVPETKPEILIGNQSRLPEPSKVGRPEKLYYMGISKSSFTYKLPSLIANSSDFKQDLIGVAIGRKISNDLFYYRGHFEMDGEWMRFKRSSSVFQQKINLFQLDLIQNIDLALSPKHLVYFSAGLGVAPVYLLGEQSVFGNSFDHFGMSGIIKFDFIFPVKRQYEFDLSLKGQWGRAGGHELFLSSINLGINFE